MCGIAGMIGNNRIQVLKTVQQMTRTLAHRGPDSEGVVVVPFGRDWLGLGHRRLAIMDLSSAGYQPLHHIPSGSIITYNGEIYNFKALRNQLVLENEQFHSETDTEVLLAYLTRVGISGISKLQGMFAFAWFKPSDDGSLVLCRDPSGIKPLYYAYSHNTLHFASEIRPLLSADLKFSDIDTNAVAAMLSYGGVQQNETLFRHIHSLPAGSNWTIRSDDPIKCPSRINIYWTPPQPTVQLSDDVLIATVRECITTSIRDHLVSDVPIAIMLSGGIDSTIIANEASLESEKVQAFTLITDTSSSIAEGEIAQRTARQFGLPHTKFHIDTGTAQRNMADWLCQMDSPSMDGLNTYIISKVIQSQGFKVALSGLGSDELFGGYPAFRELPILVRWLPLIRNLSRYTSSAMVSLITKFLSRPVVEKLYDMVRASPSLIELVRQRRRVLSNRQLALLGLNLNTKESPLPFTQIANDKLEDVTVNDLDWLISYVESHYYQQSILLRDNDVASMRHGIELRLPYLDIRLQNLIFSLSRLRRGSGKFSNKGLLRHAFFDVLPPEIMTRRKTGFDLPVASWMAGPLRDLCEDALTILKGKSILRSTGIDIVWQEFLSNPSTLTANRALVIVALGCYFKNII